MTVVFTFWNANAGGTNVCVTVLVVLVALVMGVVLIEKSSLA